MGRAAGRSQATDEHYPSRESIWSAESLPRMKAVEPEVEKYHDKLRVEHRAKEGREAEEVSELVLLRALPKSGRVFTGDLYCSQACHFGSLLSLQRALEIAALLSR